MMKITEDMDFQRRISVEDYRDSISAPVDFTVTVGTGELNIKIAVDDIIQVLLDGYPDKSLPFKIVDKEQLAKYVMEEQLALNNGEFEGQILKSIIRDAVSLVDEREAYGHGVEEIPGDWFTNKEGKFVYIPNLK